MTAKPKNWKARTGQKIEKIYAWVAEEPDGGEGIIAFQAMDGSYAPCVGADMERMESLRFVAEGAAHSSGCPIRLKVFTGGVVIDEIKL